MTEFAVECEDGRVFTIEAEDAEAAVELVARQRNLRRASLRAVPPPRHRRELAMPLFWGALGLLAAFVAWAMLS